MTSRLGDEPNFQKQVSNMRVQVQKVFSHVLPNPRIVNDITGDGKDLFHKMPMWEGGPSWLDLPAFAKPLDPGTDDKGVYRNKVWDFWMTDYDPQFHSHIFADCPFNTLQSLMEKARARARLVLDRGGQELDSA